MALSNVQILNERAPMGKFHSDLHTSVGSKMRRISPALFLATQVYRVITP